MYMCHWNKVNFCFICVMITRTDPSLQCVAGDDSYLTHWAGERHQGTSGHVLWPWGGLHLHPQCSSPSPLEQSLPLPQTTGRLDQRSHCACGAVFDLGYDHSPSCVVLAVWIYLSHRIPHGSAADCCQKEQCTINHLRVLFFAWRRYM